MTLGSDTTLRPGFNVDATFKAHGGTVRHVIYNDRLSQFISVDDKCLKAWGKDKETGDLRIAYDVLFPNYQLLFVACLDDTLRVYSEKLRLRSSMPWENGLTRSIIYNEKRAEIITAGSYGVKVWECRQDHAAYRTAIDLDPYDMPKAWDGSVLPWCFGKYQQPVVRLALNVPNSRASGAKAAKGMTADAALAAASGASMGYDSVGWCERIHLHPPAQLLFAMFQTHVYGFELRKGTCVWHLRDLHEQPVTSMVWLPDQDLLLTTSMDTVATVWRINGTSATKFRTIGKSAAATIHVTVDPEQQLVMLTALDGSVTLYALDTLETLFRMRLSRPAAYATFISRDRFYMHVDNEVKIFSIQQLFEPWMACSSQPVALRQLTYGLILAELADSSVRILDSASSALDKSVITTMPQLSLHNLVAVVASLTRGCLYALLSNSHIHVWELHLRKPPTFQEAWAHLAREQLTCMAFLDGGALDVRVAMALGLAGPGTSSTRAPSSSGAMSLPPPPAQGGQEPPLPDDHVLLGTNGGDILFCDVGRGGVTVLRLPAFKHQPVERISLDLDRNYLCTSSRNRFKVWALAEMKCVHNLEATSQITHMDVLEGRCILGTASGALHVVDMVTGQNTGVASGSDHMAAITGLGVSPYLQHFVTSGQDNQIKIFDRDKIFKASVYTGGPVSAVCYLNDAGDVLAAMSKSLVVLRAKKYDALLSDAAEPQPSMYSQLRGQGRTPRTLLRCMTSKIHRLTDAPLAMERYPAQQCWDCDELQRLDSGSQVDVRARRIRAMDTKARSDRKPSLLRTNTLATAVAHKLRPGKAGPASNKMSRAAAAAAAAGCTPSHTGEAPPGGLLTGAELVAATVPAGQAYSAQQKATVQAAAAATAAPASRVPLVQQRLTDQPAGLDGVLQQVGRTRPGPLHAAGAATTEAPVGTNPSTASPPSQHVLQLPPPIPQTNRPSSRESPPPGLAALVACGLHGQECAVSSRDATPSRRVRFPSAGRESSPSEHPGQTNACGRPSRQCEQPLQPQQQEPPGEGSWEGREQSEPPPPGQAPSNDQQRRQAAGAREPVAPGAYQRPQWSDDMGPVQSSFQTVFTFDVGQELEARRRRLHGISVESGKDGHDGAAGGANGAPATKASSTPLQAAAATSGGTGAGSPSAATTAATAAGSAGCAPAPPPAPSSHGRTLHFGSLLVEGSNGEEENSEDGSVSGGSSDDGCGEGSMLAGPLTLHRLPPMDGSKLPAAFRRALPIICSPTAFLDGMVPDEVLRAAGGKKAKGKKGRKKRRKKAKGQGSAGITALYDPMAALVATKDPRILIELKHVRQHGLMTRTLLPGLPGALKRVANTAPARVDLDARTMARQAKAPAKALLGSPSPGGVESTATGGGKEGADVTPASDDEGDDQAAVLGGNVTEAAGMDLTALDLAVVAVTSGRIAAATCAQGNSVGIGALEDGSRADSCGTTLPPPQPNRSDEAADQPCDPNVPITGLPQQLPSQPEPRYRRHTDSPGSMPVAAILDAPPLRFANYEPPSMDRMLASLVEHRAAKQLAADAKAAKAAAKKQAEEAAAAEEAAEARRAAAAASAAATEEFRSRACGRSRAVARPRAGVLMQPYNDERCGGSASGV